MKKKILAVVAHPDDEVLGCGATLARAIDQGHDVSMLILGEGITSRDLVRDVASREKELAALREDAQKANKVLGVNSLVFRDFPDNRFDSVPLLDIVKAVEEVVSDVDPDVIYTHHAGDLNVDHQITFQAVLTACRPSHSRALKELYSFEVPSSTEWNYPQTFLPNVFVDVGGFVDKKIDSLLCYSTEMKSAPHPRSPEVIRAIAARWGSQAGFSYAEAFMAIRILQ